MSQIAVKPAKSPLSSSRSSPRSSPHSSPRLSPRSASSLSKPVSTPRPATSLSKPASTPRSSPSLSPKAASKTASKPASKSGKKKRPKTPSPRLEDKTVNNNCPFVEFGCNFDATTHDVKKHIRDTPADHLEILCSGVSQLTMAIRAYQLLSEQKMLKGEDLDYRICHLDVMFSTQLIWRIENYRSLFNEAKMGKRLTVFSPPFYSFKNGYRMAASIALYGDGSGKAKHNSIFVTILRGEHDSLLHWPFACQVTFTMIDQKPSIEQRENVVVSLKPNITKENRPFLGRPSGERNPSFGIQKFVSLEDMKTKDFVKDDTCFVRVDLNIEDVPKI